MKITGRQARTRFTTVGLAAVAVFAVSAVAYRETRQGARDRRAIVSHLREMERAIRTHDASLWLHVTSTHPVAPGGAAHGAAHSAMLRDFERLQHLEGLELTDIEVEATGDTAVARYRVRSAPPRPGASPHPRAGELRFVRGPSSWEMTGHRLFER